MYNYIVPLCVTLGSLALLAVIVPCCAQKRIRAPDEFRGVSHDTAEQRQLMYSLEDDAESHPPGDPQAPVTLHTPQPPPTATAVTVAAEDVPMQSQHAAEREQEREQQPPLSPAPPVPAGIDAATQPPGDLVSVQTDQ